MFKINSKLKKKSFSIKNFKLCSARLYDNSKFIWLILIPKRNKINEIIDLNINDQFQLMNEIRYCSKILKKNFECHNLNIEKIGNIVSQLHIHIIVRHKKDPAWPLSVWVTKVKPYTDTELTETLTKLKKII